MKRKSLAAALAGLVLLATLVVSGAPPASADASDYAQQIIDTPGLQSYWRFDEPSGTTATDSGPGGVTGTYVNGPTLGASGALAGNSAAKLTTASAQSVNMGNNYNFAGTASFTFEAWIRPDSISTSGEYRRIVSVETFSPVREGWLIFQEPNTGKVGFERWSNGTPAAAYPSDSPSLGQWAHLVGTYDGNTVTFYMNGDLAASVPSTGPIGSSASLFIVGATADPWDYFDGSIDEVATYNRALSSAEVRSHYDGADKQSNTAATVKVDPSLTFTVSSQGSACNGATPTLGASSSGAAVALGRINSTSGIAAQDLSVATNVANGFAISSRSTGPLGNGAGHNIADVPWTYDGRGPFPSPGTEGFGYTIGWMSPNQWSALTGSSQTFWGGTESGAHSTCIAYQAQAGSTTPAGSYSTTVIYTATAIY